MCPQLSSHSTSFICKRNDVFLSLFLIMKFIHTSVESPPLMNSHPRIMDLLYILIMIINYAFMTKLLTTWQLFSFLSSPRTKTKIISEIYVIIGSLWFDMKVEKIDGDDGKQVTFLDNNLIKSSYFSSCEFDNVVTRRGLWDWFKRKVSSKVDAVKFLIRISSKWLST